MTTSVEEAATLTLDRFKVPDGAIIRTRTSVSFQLTYPFVCNAYFITFYFIPSSCYFIVNSFSSVCVSFTGLFIYLFIYYELVQINVPEVSRNKSM